MSGLHLTLFPLSNEYLAAAHSLSWGLATGRSDISLYHRLVVASTSVLYAVLADPSAHPYTHIQARLRLASVLLEETQNSDEVEDILARGIALASKQNDFVAALEMKMLAATAAWGKSKKSAARMLDAAAEDARVVGLREWVKVKVLKASLMVAEGDAIQGAQELTDLETMNGLEGLAAMVKGLRALVEIREGRGQSIKVLLNEMKQLEMTTPSVSPQAKILRIMCQILVSLEGSQYDTLERGLIPELNQTLASVQSWPLDGGLPIPLQIPNDPYAVINVSWISQSEANIIALLLTGLVRLRITNDTNRSAKAFFKQAHKQIKSDLAWPDPTADQSQPPMMAPIMSLQHAIRRRDRLVFLRAYTLMYLTLESFLMSAWTYSGYLREVSRIAQQLPPDLNEQFLPFTFYLSGVYFQATGNAHNAIQFYLKIRSLIPNTGELHIFALMNLVLLLEAPQQQHYNTFTAVPLESERSAMNGASTPSQYFRSLLSSLCKLHPNPNVRYAHDLVSATLPTLTEVQLQNKLSTLLRYAMALNISQLGSIVAYLGAPRAPTADQKLKLGKKGVSEAGRTGDSIWSWMNGKIVEGMLREQGKEEEAQEMGSWTVKWKDAVEKRLNRVD